MRYELPHPIVLRLIFTAFGLFVVFIAPYELWRGVYPLNLTTPFYGIIMFGGISCGLAFIAFGLLAPAAVLHLSKGILQVERSYFWGVSRQTIRLSDITAIDVVLVDSSDGPDTHFAVIRPKISQEIRSRPLSTRAAAERQALEFKTLLGFVDGEKPDPAN